MNLTNELNTVNMKPTMDIINNNIFVSAFTGVVLFIAALAYTITNLSNITTFDRSAMLIAGTLGFASISLITMAVKADNDRLKQQA